MEFSIKRNALPIFRCARSFALEQLRVRELKLAQRDLVIDSYHCCVASSLVYALVEVAQEERTDVAAVYHVDVVRDARL